MSRPSKPSSPSPQTPGRRGPTNHESPAEARSASAPTVEQIAVRAYEIFIARGGQPGRDQEDWYQAENELRLGRQ